MSAVVEHLTVCILTKNEEQRIGRAVTSVANLGAKVLIVDSFSNDGTFAQVQLAWEAADRLPADLAFVARRWEGFVRMREWSLSQVSTRWVLWLDADEWIELDLAQWLHAHLEYLGADDVYAFRRQSIFLGRRLRYGGWYPDYKTRLCRVGHAEWRSGPRGAQVHEDMVPTLPGGRRRTIEAHLGHLPFRDESEQRATNESYSSLLAEGVVAQWLSANRRPYGRVMIFAKVLVKFIENYFWKLGFLDGKAGRIIALGSAWSLRRRLEKARELYWAQKK